MTSTGLVTLTDIPQDTEVFRVYYWYTLNNTDVVVNYYLDNFVAKASEPYNLLSRFSNSLSFNHNLGVKPSHSEGITFYDKDKKALSYYNEEADIIIKYWSRTSF